MKPNGYIIHETDVAVVIATGFKRGSKNPKTGAMIQTWILYRALDPVLSVKVGADLHVCGLCPLRGDHNKARACFVRVGNAPLSVWRAYHRDRYPHLTTLEPFRGRMVRFGSYGEPVAIPLDTIRAIARVASGWTGYTHQWRLPLFAGYREFLMASCDARDYLEAQAMGWRTFTVSREKLDKQVVCPTSKEAGHRVNCAQCRLCSGTSRAARSIQIRPHGFGQKYAA